MVRATESAPSESDSPRRAGLRCMLMSVDRARMSVVDSRDDPVTVYPPPEWRAPSHCVSSIDRINLFDDCLRRVCFDLMATDFSISLRPVESRRVGGISQIRFD